MKNILYFIFFVFFAFSCAKDKEGLILTVSLGKDGPMYYVDTGGNILFNRFFCQAKPFQDGYAAVMADDGKWGFINKSGREVIPFIYEEATSFSEGIAGVKVDNKWGYINKKGETIISYKYEKCTLFSEGIASVVDCIDGSFNLEKYWKIIDITGKDVFTLDEDYSSISEFHNGLAYVTYGPRIYGYYSIEGDYYEHASYLSDGFTHVTRDGKSGFVNSNGKLVIPCIYDDAQDFSEGLAAVMTKGKWGFIDYEGRLVIPFMYEDLGDDLRESLYSFSDGLSAASINGKIGYINKNGETVIPFIYDDCGYFDKGYANVEMNGEKYYIDKTGKPLCFSYIGDFSESVAAVEYNDKWGFIDSKANVVIPCVYQYAGSFYEGRACVKCNGKYGYIDHNNNLVIPCIYQSAWSFSNGLAAVKNNEKWGYINHDGKLIFDYCFDEVTYFNNNIAIVKLDDKIACINTSGAFVVPPTSDIVKIYGYSNPSFSGFVPFFEDSDF